jgi:hypothetical protein
MLGTRDERKAEGRHRREGRRRRQPQGKAPPGKQDLNRRRMGVGRDHRAASMKRGGRGTYP